MSPFFLRPYGRIKRPKQLNWAPLEWQGLKFNNRLGIAGGVDKDGDMIQGWWAFGSGFVEVGTITPQPQGPNPGKIMDRFSSAQAVWNRMGFPSRGLEYASRHLEKVHGSHFTPVFANIGKNRDTSLEDASKDYITCIKRLNSLVDGFVVNISSPNTKGLRELLKPENLRSFLDPVVGACKERQRPVLLKVSPDISEQELAQILETSLDLDIDGWILTNTSAQIRKGLPFPTEGGVSGRPLSETSKEHLRTCLKLLGPRRQGKLIVSVGGVMTPEDVIERIEMGADLVQVYAALIYEGPGFFSQVAHQARHHSFARSDASI